MRLVPGFISLVMGPLLVTGFNPVGAAIGGGASDATRSTWAHAQADPEADESRVEQEYSPALQACLRSDDAAKGVSVAMGACVHAELELQDAQLNAVYRIVMRKLPLPRRTVLRDEQRGWIKYRDRQCDEVAMGGTIDLVDVPACLLSETVRRRLKLQSMTS